MDFSTVLQRVRRLLDQFEVRYAVIGGLAMAAYGLARTTLDLDMVVEARSQDTLIKAMESEGYGTLHRSRAFSNHSHPDAAMGNVDFVYVDGDTADRLFADVRQFSGPRGSFIPVPSPEHLAAMKVVAMKNDPQRTFQEQADIRHLILNAGADPDEVRRQYARHGLEDQFRKLQGSL